MLNYLEHGKGIIYYENGNIFYEGDFVNGKREGNGKCFSENGDYYRGQWFNDKPHGKGKLYNNNDIILYMMVSWSMEKWKGKENVF